MTETREAYLLRALDAFDPILSEAGYNKRPKVRISVGFPRGSRRAIGQCWAGNASKDGANHIFISPTLVKPVEVLATVLHEYGHAIIGCEHGHRSPFVKFCKAVGLSPPWTATSASEALVPVLRGMAQSLGEYPHAGLAVAAGHPKQSTRLRLFMCPGCGLKVRIARDYASLKCEPCGEVLERQ